MNRDQHPTADEVVAHEVGHLLVGTAVGRTVQRIEWIAHPDGRPRGRVVMSQTTWCQEQQGAEEEAQLGRLRIAVSGAVAVSLAGRRELSVDLLDNEYCDDDRGQAEEAVGRLVVLNRAQGRYEEVVVDAMHDAAQMLQSDDNQWLASQIAGRLRQLREAKPLGLVVLDSREIDVIMRRIDIQWVDPAPANEHKLLMRIRRVGRARLRRGAPPMCY